MDVQTKAGGSSDLERVKVGQSWDRSIKGLHLCLENTAASTRTDSSGRACITLGNLVGKVLPSTEPGSSGQPRSPSPCCKIAWHLDVNLGLAGIGGQGAGLYLHDKVDSFT